MPQILTENRVLDYARRAEVDIRPFGSLGWIIPSQSENVPSVSLTEYNNKILFNVLPVVTIKPTTNSALVMEYLLRANARHPLATYALEEHGQVLLWAVCSEEVFSYQFFLVGLKAVREALSEDLLDLRKFTCGN